MNYWETGKKKKKKTNPIKEAMTPWRGHAFNHVRQVQNLNCIQIIQYIHDRII